MMHKKGIDTRILGKDVLPMAGEYTGQVMLDGISAYLRANAPELLAAQVLAPNAPGENTLAADLARWFRAGRRGFARAVPSGRSSLPPS